MRLVLGCSVLGSSLQRFWLKPAMRLGRRCFGSALQWSICHCAVLGFVVDCNIQNNRHFSIRHSSFAQLRVQLVWCEFSVRRENSFNSVMLGKTNEY